MIDCIVLIDNNGDVIKYSRTPDNIWTVNYKNKTKVIKNVSMLNSIRKVNKYMTMMGAILNKIAAIKKTCLNKYHRVLSLFK